MYENRGTENLSRRMIRVDSSGWMFSSSDGSRKIFSFEQSIARDCHGSSISRAKVSSHVWAKR